jgi:pSer/pThr/pTyr-binding forkhead associated (FHA) protein
LFAKNALSLDGSISNLSSGLSLPNDRTITISVIAGSSNGTKHQLTKAKTSIGRTGGGADIEIDDPQVSPLHCVVGVANDIVRLCDLDSVSGTYANEERVQAAELEHLSEFRLGSTWLVVTIVPKHLVDSTSF